MMWPRGVNRSPVTRSHGSPGVMERQWRCPCRSLPAPPLPDGAMTSGPFIGLHLAAFHQNDAARSPSAELEAAGRIEDNRWPGVVRQCLENTAATAQDSSPRYVRAQGQRAGRCVANERGSARDLSSNTVEQSSSDDGLVAMEIQGLFIGRDRHALEKIGIEHPFDIQHLPLEWFREWAQIPFRASRGPALDREVDDRIRAIRLGDPACRRVTIQIA